jgi:hypothetical protein
MRAGNSITLPSAVGDVMEEPFRMEIVAAGNEEDHMGFSANVETALKAQ